MNNINKDHVIQEPVESIASWPWRAIIAHMKVPVAEALEGLKELVNQFFDDYEFYVSNEIQMEGDPTSFKEAMRSVYSFKW